jgi:hypothetical protein
LFSCDTGKSSNFQSGLKLKSPDPVSTSIILRRLNVWRNFMAFTGASVDMLKGLIFSYLHVAKFYLEGLKIWLPYKWKV